MNKSSPHKEERTVELVKHLTAEFIARESNHQSLITVTSAQISDRLQRVAILVTVLPATEEQAVLKFLRRQVNDLREHLRKNTRIGRIPFIVFDIDRGEHNRQRIEELSNKLA